MGVYEQQIQATANYYVPDMHKTEHNSGEILSSGDRENDPREYEWAEVLRDLEAFY